MQGKGDEYSQGIIKCYEPRISTDFTLDFPGTKCAFVKFETTYAPWGFRSVRPAFPNVQKRVENIEVDSLPSVWFRPILSCEIMSLQENKSRTDKHLPGLW